jgi:nucleoside diphosphate kinase
MAETAHMVVFIKPDKVQHRLVDVTIARFERRGTRLVVLNTVQPTRELAACHYAVHQDKPFFESYGEHYYLGTCGCDGAGVFEYRRDGAPN